MTERYFHENKAGASSIQFLTNCFVLKLSNPFLKPISVCMNHQFYNDQAYIAESFHLADDFTEQTARLAFFKINSYKLSLIKAAFAKSREELKSNLRNSLLNYTNAGIILADLGFFQSEADN